VKGGQLARSLSFPLTSCPGPRYPFATPTREAARDGRPGARESQADRPDRRDEQLIFIYLI